MDTRQRDAGTTIGGLVLIVLGVVFFVVTQGAFDLDWGNIWPIFPTLGGLLLLAMAFFSQSATQRNSLVFAGTIPLLLGFFFFATTRDILSWGLWPIYPLVVGVAFMAAYFSSGFTQRNYLIPGFILVAVGMVFMGIVLADAYDVLSRIWPIFMIIAGVLLLAGRFRRAEG